jgi:ribosome-binding protein aMBF1 (putative translation factor)
MKNKRIPKKAVPLGLIWWKSQKRHPLNRYAGRVVYRLRSGLGWALEDLARATGLTKSYLCKLEHGMHSPTLEVQLRLETVFGLVSGGLLQLARNQMQQA